MCAYVADMCWRRRFFRISSVFRNTFRASSNVHDAKGEKEKLDSGWILVCLIKKKHFFRNFWMNVGQMRVIDAVSPLSPLPPSLHEHIYVYLNRCIKLCEIATSRMPVAQDHLGADYAQDGD